MVKIRTDMATAEKTMAEATQKKLENLILVTGKQDTEPQVII